jgi:hypothetical protein
MEIFFLSKHLAVYFVQANRPNVGKLNLRVVKCIFVGYSDIQKGYVCWSPARIDYLCV